MTWPTCSAPHPRSGASPVRQDKVLQQTRGRYNPITHTNIEQGKQDYHQQKKKVGLG